MAAAVFLTVIGKSFRNSKDADLIRYGEQEFNINLSIKEDITENISIKYEKNREKYMAYNKKYYRENKDLWQDFYRPRAIIKGAKKVLTK